MRGEPFTTSDSGTATDVPDIAITNFGITEQSSSLIDAQTNANKKTQTLVAALKNLGVEDRDIKTTSYNVSPNYDYSNQPYKILGYSVSVNYMVKIRNLDKVNESLNAATAAGANSVGGISLTFSDEKQKELLDKARKEAIDKAKSKGESLANLSGLSLGKIINVSESGGAVPVAQRNYGLDSSLKPASAPIPEADIQAGESEVNVTVTISWEIR